MEISDCDPRVIQRLKHEVISKMLFSDLCKTLETQQYYPYLRHLGVLSKSDEEEIDNNVTSVGKRRALLDKLLTRTDAYDVLVRVLREYKVQAFLIEKLESMLARLVRERASEYQGTIVQTDNNDDDDDLDLEIPQLPMYHNRASSHC